MAVYKLFPSQDASIYSAYPAMNTGLDPILDVANYVTDFNPTSNVSRFLVKFDQDQINNVLDNIASVTESLNFTASLKSFVAKATNVILESKIKAYPISGSWNNGSGQYLDNIQNTNGVSWVYSAYSGSSPWPIDNFSSYVTGSYSGSNNAGGGVWWTGSGGYTGIGSLEATQSFNLRSEKDLELNVTDTVKVWYSSSNSLISGLPLIQNEGFIIKWEDSKEFITSSAVTPQLSFYSIDTNTIYPPQLEIKWRDFTYDTGSLEVINTPDLFVALDNNAGVFYSESINQFRLNVRPQFPVRTFETSSMYTHNHALPSSSYYAIKDLDTNEFVVDFDTQNTQISCDATGSYFTVYMNGLEPERYYQILVQTTIDNNTIVMDENYYFKVVNG
jgi:hypothetical protein